MKNVKIYTDGACEGNPGRGGYGIIMMTKINDKIYKKEFSQGYKLTTNNYQTFRNIQILFCGKEWVMISKISSPSIHFVIHHPKLRDAIENFIPPVVEE